MQDVNNVDGSPSKKVSQSPDGMNDVENADGSHNKEVSESPDGEYGMNGNYKRNNIYIMRKCVLDMQDKGEMRDQNASDSPFGEFWVQKKMDKLKNKSNVLGIHKDVSGDRDIGVQRTADENMDDGGGTCCTDETCAVWNDEDNNNHGKLYRL